jgi:hypothetical protein
MHRPTPSLALPLLLAALGCASTPPIESCRPVGAATPLCGFQNPEDLALLPGARHVLVSEYGYVDRAQPGRLSLLDLDTRERRVLFEGGTPRAAGPWGAPDCQGPPPPEFSPHGIDLHPRGDGALQLLVVQHGGRESVEMFEVTDVGGGWHLEWRGCVEALEGDAFNDIVALPDGGFLVTRPLPAGAGLFTFVGAALFGRDTGFVQAWQPTTGFTPVAGTEGRYPNGIEVSPDGKKIFLNQTLGNEVTRIDRASGQVEARAEVSNPDNSTWASDGRLWVASLQTSLSEMRQCSELERGSCPMAFAIVAVDPETMETEVLYEGGPGTPSGAGTVGLEIPRGLLIGTFAGDRVVWVER